MKFITLIAIASFLLATVIASTNLATNQTQNKEKIKERGLKLFNILYDQCHTLIYGLDSRNKKPENCIQEAFKLMEMGLAELKDAKKYLDEYTKEDCATKITKANQEEFMANCTVKEDGVIGKQCKLYPRSDTTVLDKYKQDFPCVSSRIEFESCSAKYCSEHKTDNDLPKACNALYQCSFLFQTEVNKDMTCHHGLHLKMVADKVAGEVAKPEDKPAVEKPAEDKPKIE